jgi:hypothetical protein
VYSGRWYDVWQRPASLAQPILEHVGLGTPLQPAGIAPCDQVLRLARLAGSNGKLAAVFRLPVVVVQLADMTHPTAWSDPGGADLLLGQPGSATTSVYVANPGRYTVWLGGSVRSQVDVLFDGRVVGSLRGQFNVTGQWTDVGRLDLPPGAHRLELRYAGPDLVPGSGGAAVPLGPLALSLETTPGEPVAYVSPANARSLCGKSLDWIEAVRA